MTHRTIMVSIVVGIVVPILASPSLAAAACYMKIGDVTGESQNPQFRDWVEVERFSPRLPQSPQAQPRTQSSPGQITIVKRMDKASPKLLQYASNGKHFSKGVLTCRKAAEKPERYLKYEFTNVMVSSVEPTGSMEEVTFTYQKLRIEWMPQERKEKPRKPKS